MATTTLARRISRIGLLPSTYSQDDGSRILNYDPEITDKGRAFIADGLRDAARSARVKMHKARGVKPAGKIEAAPVKGKQAVNESKAKAKK